MSAAGALTPALLADLRFVERLACACAWIFIRADDDDPLVITMDDPDAGRVAGVPIWRGLIQDVLAEGPSPWRLDAGGVAHLARNLHGALCAAADLDDRARFAREGRIEAVPCVRDLEALIIAVAAALREEP